MRHPRRLLAAATATLALTPLVAPAHAADPIMPLDQVQKGMRCTGLSVVRDTTISSFDVEVLDVLRGEQVASDARILVRVSGPVVDATGLGPGFSGSPVLCRDGAGLQRNAGAISETVGEFGGKVALATPIEQVLAEPADVPAAPAAPGTRRLAGPLTFSGLAEPLARILRRAGRGAGRLITTSPAMPRAAFPPVALRPGAAMAVGLATGDLNAGAIGTVAYVDGDRVWALGHELDGTGRRSLLLQDAYVYTVVNNPNATQDASTYKLASAGNDLGTLTNDAPDAVVGRLGELPRRFPLRIVSKDLDTGRTLTHETTLTDERPFDEPAGVSALTTVAPVALAQVAYETLRGSPTQQSGSMCVRAVVRERSRALRFCNRYVGGGGPGAAGSPMVADLLEAAALLDSYRLADLAIERVSVNLQVRRELRQAYLRRLAGPDVVRRGRTITLRVTARKPRGGTVTRRLRVRVPRSLEAGGQELTLVGTPADRGDPEGLGEILELSLGGEDGEDEPDDDPGPTSLGALARSFAALHRTEGVRLTFRGPAGARSPARRVLEDPELRFSGTVRLPVLVR